jgi:L,D-transpeptidase YcbB
MSEAMRRVATFSRQRSFRSGPAAPRRRRDRAGLVCRKAFAVAIAIGALGLRPSQALADPLAPPPTPTAPAAIDPGTLPATLTPFAGDSGLEDRLDPRRVIVAGERLHEHLVRRFYAVHQWKPVWESHPDAATALLAGVLRADQHGLDPPMFHSRVLTQSSARLSPVERELLLSDAVLAYADALARGAMPVEERPDDEDLQPVPVDIAATVDAAMSSPDPAKVIEALAPTSSDYVALRHAYADYLAIAAGARRPSLGDDDGGIRVTTAEALRRARQIAINLERLRWLPRDMPVDRLVVDAAISQLTLFRGDVPVFTTRVVVGEVDKQTPELQSLVKEVLFNPPWNIPPSIVRKEILPKIAANHNYLTQHHMRWRGPMSVQQEAGPYSALGRLKFEMDDRFDVYLHDTPEKWRFQSADRMMSHGCVRVENPRELASLLLGESPERIDAAIAVDRTHGRALPKSVPVFIVYRTVAPESDGRIAFRGDPYGRDPEIWAYLSRARDVSVAQKSVAGSTERSRAAASGSTITQKTATIGE